MEPQVMIATTVAGFIGIGTAAAVANAIGRDTEHKWRLFQLWAGVLVGFVLGIAIVISWLQRGG